MNTLRKRITYANVMATIAVFLALGGVSYAAFKLPKNSVGPRQIKRNAVTAAKIKQGAVSAGKLAPGAVSSLQGPQGAQGPQGPAGEPGSAIAFAAVSEAGVINQARSKNMESAKVTRVGSDEYCFSGLSFSPKVAVASPQFYEPKPVTLAVHVGDPVYEGCPPGTQVSVATLEEGNKGRSSPFMIIFD